MATRLAWLETLTMAPPRPSRIIDRDVYLVTSRAPRALMLITLSKTAMSVSIGVAISPPYPPQFTTPYRSSPSSTSRTLSSEVRSNGSGRAPVSPAKVLSVSSERPPATTSAPAAANCLTVSPPIPPLAPVTSTVRPSKSVVYPTLTSVVLPDGGLTSQLLGQGLGSEVARTRTGHNRSATKPGQPRIDRRGGPDAMREKDNLSIQVVGLDVSGAPGQRLPGRAAQPAIHPGHWLHREASRTSRRLLGIIDVGDVGGVEDRPRLTLGSFD